MVKPTRTVSRPEMTGRCFVAAGFERAQVGAASLYADDVGGPTAAGGAGRVAGWRCGLGVALTRDAHRHRDDVLADIDTGAPLIQNLHPTAPFPAIASQPTRTLRCAPKHELRDWYSRSQQQPGDTQVGAPASFLSTATHGQGDTTSAPQCTRRFSFTASRRASADEFLICVADPRKGWIRWLSALCGLVRAPCRAGGSQSGSRWSARRAARTTTLTPTRIRRKIGRRRVMRKWCGSSHRCLRARTRGGRPPGVPGPAWPVAM